MVQSARTGQKLKPEQLRQTPQRQGANLDRQHSLARIVLGLDFIATAILGQEYIIGDELVYVCTAHG